MKQYPHILYALKTVANSSQDEDGNWTADSESEQKIGICRNVTEGRGREIVGLDGKSYMFSNVIFLPKTASVIEAGTIVMVRDSEDSTTNRAKGSVLRFEKGQLHSVIWIL